MKSRTKFLVMAMVAMRAETDKIRRQGYALPSNDNLGEVIGMMLCYHSSFFGNSDSSIGQPDKCTGLVNEQSTCLRLHLAEFILTLLYQFLILFIAGFLLLFILLGDIIGY